MSFGALNCGYAWLRTTQLGQCRSKSRYSGRQTEWLNAGRRSMGLWTLVEFIASLPQISPFTLYT